MDVQTVLGAVWRQRLIAVAVLLVMAVAVTIGLYYAPRSYTSSATVSAATDAESTAAESDLESLRATLGELVDSSDVLEDVQQRLSVVRSLEQLRSAVSGQWVQGTILVEITVTDRNPDVAAEIANSVAEVLPMHDPSSGSFTFTRSDPAEPAESFSSPNLPLVLGVATLLGLILAAIAAVVRDRLRRRVTNKVALAQALSAPVLATIAPPRDETSLPALYPGTDASNVFRELRLALEAVATDDPVHKIVVTGVVPGDVNVWLGANLAIALAQVDRRVLLIDGRMGDQHGRPIDAAPDSAGLYDVLQNGGLLQAVSQGPVERLAVLPAGDSGGAPTERIVESRFGTITAEAVDKFDVVIVLAPALSEGQDAVVMAVDGSLLLAIPSGKVTVATLREHAMHLRSVGVRLIGSVLLDPRGRRASG